MKEERLDKTIFRKQSFREADDQRRYWLSRTPEERLHAGYCLSMRAYGHDPENPPRMEKRLFYKGKQEEREQS